MRYYYPNQEYNSVKDKEDVSTNGTLLFLKLKDWIHLTFHFRRSEVTHEIKKWSFVLKTDTEKSFSWLGVSEQAATELKIEQSVAKSYLLQFLNLYNPRVFQYKLKESDGLFYHQDIPFSGVGVTTEYGGNYGVEANYWDGKLSGVYQKYYCGLVVEYDHYIDGEKTGLCKQFQWNGELWFESHYENGKQHGISKTYYLSGALNSVVNFLEGKMDGLYKGYYESGKLQYECNYKEGEPYGVSKEYYENRKNIKVESPYEGGKLNGVVKEYYFGGLPKSETQYKDGKKHGVYQEYYAKTFRKVKLQQFWNAGNFISGERESFEAVDGGIIKS